MNCSYGCPSAIPGYSDKWNLTFTDSCGMDVNLGSDVKPVIGTSMDYELAENKPSINGVTLIGNKTNEELDIGALSNMDIENILNSFI